MKWLVFPIFYFLYWGMCFLCTGTQKKNLLGLRSYPEQVQSVIYHDPVLSRQAPKKKSIAQILLSNLLLFAVVFSLLGRIFRRAFALTDFSAAFVYFLLLGEGLGLFDLLVIDLLWWRNTRRIRFDCLPDKKYYRDSSKHIGSFLRGIPLFAAVAAVAAGVTVL